VKACKLEPPERLVMVKRSGEDKGVTRFGGDGTVGNVAIVRALRRIRVLSS
jgi:hypothetical protein